MSDDYFVHVGHNDPSKRSVNRSHVGPVLVGMALVGGVATYAYKYKSPEPVNATPSSPTSTIPAASPRFDLVAAPHEAGGSLDATVTLGENQKSLRDAYAAPLAATSKMGAMRAPPAAALLPARQKTSGHVTGLPLRGEGFLGPANADLLELGPSSGTVGRHSTSSATAPLARNPALITLSSTESTHPAQKTEVGPTSTEQSSMANMAATDEVADSEPSTQGNSSSTSAGPQAVADELVEEAPAAVDDASIGRSSENMAILAAPESANAKIQDIPPGEILGQIPKQAPLVRTGSAAAPPPMTPPVTPNLKAAKGYAQFYMPTFFNGREIGSIPLRIALDKEVSVHLGSFLSLFRSAMETQLFERLRRSPNAQEYVSLASIKSAGFNLYYDIMDKRLILGVNELTHIKQIRPTESTVQSEADRQMSTLGLAP